jgi:long-chain fatty acid transport protein
MYMLPAIGISAPLGDDDSLHIGFIIGVTAGMGADFGPMSAGVMGTTRQFSQMQFWKMAPTIAKKINDQLSVALSINIDYQAVQLVSTYASEAGTGGINAATNEGTMGYGFTAGVLYDVNPMISIGASYSSTQSMGDMKFRLGAGALTLLDPATGSGLVNSGGTYTMGLDAPSQYAIGIAVRPTEALTITADYKMINFSESFDDVDMGGDYWVFAGGAPTGATTSNATLNFGWEDVSVIAVALQYQVNDGLWLRAGYNRGDSAVPEEKAFTNTALPAVAEDHYTVGASANLGSHWQGHLSYVSSPKNEVTDPATGTKISLGGSSAQFGFSYRF